ncbi:hypothetical protein GOODEAATRI_001808 [Goodea atripinnis]|uniref:Uncharacterized protein n=1 Tax=Goodea atripinnis TaxID=208336 RepID=A0ABV0MXY3_9TELE
MWYLTVKKMDYNFWKHCTGSLFCVTPAPLSDTESNEPNKSALIHCSPRSGDQEEFLPLLPSCWKFASSPSGKKRDLRRSAAWTQERKDATSERTHCIEGGQSQSIYKPSLGRPSTFTSRISYQRVTTQDVSRRCPPSSPSIESCDKEHPPSLCRR